MFLKIAVVQFAIDQFNPQQNLARAEQFIADDLHFERIGANIHPFSTYLNTK